MGLQMLTPRLSKIRKTRRLERFGVKTHTYVGLPNHRIASSCDRTLKRNQQMSVNFVRCIFSNMKKDSKRREINLLIPDQQKHQKLLLKLGIYYILFLYLIKNIRKNCNKIYVYFFNRNHLRVFLNLEKPFKSTLPQVIFQS